MTAERFYRGSNRSPFRGNYTDGTLGLSTARDSATVLDPGQISDTRVKRLQIVCCLPKSTQERAGWLAFLRVGADEVIDISTLSFDDPKVLRPKVFVVNEDHAIYVELFLEAINLSPNERILILGYASATQNVRYAAKWYTETSIH